MRSPLALFVMAAAAVAFSSDAPARVVESWPYQRLRKEADLVVLANALETKAADGDTFRSGLWDIDLVGQNTTLKVNLVLKGEPPAERVTVLHFKLGEPKADDSPVIENPPLLVTFRTSYVATVKNVDLSPPEYLLFLRRRKDGRYEPLSRTDAAFAVREVFGLGVTHEVNWRKQPRPDVLGASSDSPPHRDDRRPLKTRS